jgi:gamma-glutamyltranspeptidase/glutathione hydrolase
MHFPALARALRLIAEKGAEEFYHGAIAEEIVEHLGKKGSLLSWEDFAQHRTDWVKPIATAFAGHDILEIPPNGQGLTVLIALNILNRTGLRRHEAGSTGFYHLLIEALKLAWVFRNRHIADPEFSEIPLDMLLGDQLADKLAGLLDPKKALDVRVALPQSDTVYLAVVDKNRLAVSFINSVYDGFGSCIVTPKTGIALQNRGACFVTTPGHPNCIGPAKRPLHTIIPAMAKKDGRVDMAFGVMGGDFQPMGHMMLAVNRYVFGLDPQAAIDMARVFPRGGEVLYEAALPHDVQRGLSELGHRLIPSGGPMGGGQAIAIDWEGHMLIGGSEPRKDGLALGY